MASFKPRSIYSKDAVKDHPKVPPDIASPPLCTTLVAPRKSGKSALVCGLIEDVYSNVFDRVVIMSDTVLFDQSIKEFSEITRKNNIYFCDQVDNFAIETIVAHQKQTKNKESILLYIDDAADSARSKNLSRELDKLFTKSRHWNISIIVCCQSITSQLSRKQKNCTTEWIVFKNNTEDMKTISKVLSTAHADEKQVFTFLVDATKDPYAFAYVNMAKNRKEDIYRYCDKDGFHDYF